MTMTKEEHQAHKKRFTDGSIKTIDDYEMWYEVKWASSCDVSPFGVQRATERRMIREFKEFFSKKREDVNAYAKDKTMG